MQIKSFEVNEIILTKIDSKSRKISLQINFNDNSSMPVELVLEENFEAMIEKLIKQIKIMKKPESNFDDDFLGHVSVINISNEEDIKEKTPKRFYMLDRKLDNFRQARDYKNYMNIYSQLSTLQEIIYEKK